MKHYLHSHPRPGAWLMMMAATVVYLLISDQFGLVQRGMWEDAGAVDVFVFVTLGWLFRSLWPE
jgi:hypothetical protein